MSVASAEILSSAERCFAEACEMGYRNSISRAYYAFYHEVKANLTGLPAYTRDHHSGLISYLKNKSESNSEPYDPLTLKSMAYKLEQQRLARNEADYDLASCQIDKARAEHSLYVVRTVFSQWQKMKVIDAIRPL